MPSITRHRRAGRSPKIGSFLGDAWDIVTHPADDVNAVIDAVKDPGGTITKLVVDTATWGVEVGGAGVAGAILGGVVGIFVMNPALGAEIGLKTGLIVGEGAAEVAPDSVKEAVQQGMVAIYDGAGHLIAGDPGAPAAVLFVPPPPPKEDVNLSWLWKLSVQQKLMFGLPVRKVADVGAKIDLLNRLNAADAASAEGATNAQPGGGSIVGVLAAAAVCLLGIWYVTRH